jgi:hypothetical protein
MMSNTIKFVCPCCAAEHQRGYVDGVCLFRCLGCGYSGYGFHPDPVVDRELFEEHTASNSRARELGLPEERPFEAWEPGRSVIRTALGLAP